MWLPDIQESPGLAINPKLKCDGKPAGTSTTQSTNNAGRPVNSAVTQGSSSNAGQGNGPGNMPERKAKSYQPESNTGNGNGQQPQNNVPQSSAREYRAPQSSAGQPYHPPQDAHVTSMPQTSVQSQRNVEQKKQQQQQSEPQHSLRRLSSGTRAGAAAVSSSVSIVGSSAVEGNVTAAEPKAPGGLPRPNFSPKSPGLRPRSRSFSSFNSTNPVAPQQR